MRAGQAGRQGVPDREGRDDHHPGHRPAEADPSCTFCLYVFYLFLFFPAIGGVCELMLFALKIVGNVQRRGGCLHQGQRQDYVLEGHGQFFEEDGAVKQTRRMAFGLFRGTNVGGYEVAGTETGYTILWRSR